jgi:hypothetical protein
MTLRKLLKKYFMNAKDFEKINFFINTHAHSAGFGQLKVFSPFSIYCGSREFKLAKDDTIDMTSNKGTVTLLFGTQKPPDEKYEGGFFSRVGTFMNNLASTPRADFKIETITGLKDAKSEIIF